MSYILVSPQKDAPILQMSPDHKTDNKYSKIQIGWALSLI